MKLPQCKIKSNVKENIIITQPSQLTFIARQTKSGCKFLSHLVYFHDYRIYRYLTIFDLIFVNKIASI